MKAQKLFATLTLGLIVAAGVIAKFLPVTMAISRTAIVFGAALGIAFASGAFVFFIRTRQADVENQRYRVWLTQIGQMSAIIVTDVRGVMEWVSEGFTRITGYQFEEAMGRVPGELLQGADADQTAAAQIGAALRDGQPVVSELINYTKNGRAIWIGMHIRSMINERGVVSGHVAILADITERVEAEERERTLQRQLLESSHRAGMAEIATGVLHNVGDALNSLGDASTTARRELQALRLDRLQQASSMINNNRATLATYMSEDARGRHLPELLSALSAQLVANAQAVETELHTIDQLLDHLRSIVSAQQSLAQLGGLREPIRLRVQAAGAS